MNEREEFFSPKHKQLLSIALWAKYLAWIALVAFIFVAITNYFGTINIFNAQFISTGQSIKDFIGLFKMFPDEAIKLLFKSISILVQGIVYFLALKGISLGLNMIVETDINYREKENQGGGK